MAIISIIDRTNPKGRLAMLAIYAVLFLGAISMLYPFLLMLRMTTSDPIDQTSVSILPRYLWEENISARKYLLKQYRLVPARQLPAIYGARDWSNLNQVEDFYDRHLAPFDALPAEKLATRIADYEAFKAQADLLQLYPLATYRPDQSFEDFFIVNWLARREGVSPKTYQFYEPIHADFARRDWVPPFDKSWTQWQDWLAQLPPSQRLAASAHAQWQAYLAEKYRGQLPALNAAHATAYSDFNHGPWFSPEPPAQASPGLLADWTDFVTSRYPLVWQSLRPSAAETASADWRDYLAQSVAITTADEWTRRTGLPADQGYTNLPLAMPPDQAAARWWSAFVATRIPASDRVITSPEADFTAFLRTRHPDLASLNAAWGTDFATWDSIRFPQAEADYAVIKTHANGILWDISLGNYRTVFKALVLEGRAFSNTAIILALSILTSLTVNPIAAYALSRFRVKGTQKILIFLLATLALPGEVAMVPGFLLVRDLHLIDTYWALVLPTAANAFSIFLLKGFFDSLPQELYEAALIDGAGEFTLFTRITIPLSMPILAVTLLGTVTHAYNIFMPAVMYLGDTNMWPIATSIYRIGQTSSAGVGMAALVVSSIFPLLVFVFCQRIIMRGIILPSMK